MEDGKRPQPRSGKTGCPIEISIAVIGGVWKPLILFSLLSGAKRYGALSRLVPNATQRVMTLHLRQLEADGIIRRTAYAGTPLRVKYELTDLGWSLEPLLQALHAWGSQYLSHDGRLEAGS